jgi:hypothetical protein
MMIQISNLVRTFRLYGWSDHPKKINGIFGIRKSDFDIRGVRIVEGHVNKSGEPHRLISFEDESNDQLLSDLLESTESATIELYDEKERFDFTVKRVAEEVIGTSEEIQVSQPYRGSTRMADDADAVVDLYESESTGARKFYINASRGVVNKLQHCIKEKGVCMLTTE